MIIALGLSIGIFVTLIGGGGASLYLGVLTSQLHMPLAQAVPTSLFVAFPPLLIASILQAQNHNIAWRLAGKLIVGAIPGIIVGTAVSRFIPTKVYDISVGILFIVMGGLVLKKYFFPTSTTTATTSPLKAYALALLSGLMVGIGGLSGGATTAAGLAILGVPTILAAGTTTFILTITSLIGLVSHLLVAPIEWLNALGLMAGAMLGAFITPKIVSRFDPKTINRILTPFLGGVIIYFGIALMLKAI